MKLFLTSIWIAIALACNPAAAEEQKADTGNPWLTPAAAVGFSYPLVFSVQAGVLLPLGKGMNDIYPTSPSLRLDGEIGLGGGSVAAGLYISTNESTMINIKAERIRTWLLTWDEKTNRTFDGGVVEFVIPAHIPVKIGLGRFKDTKPLNNKRESFTYVFFGIGL
jgi:hypothetical protein